MKTTINEHIVIGSWESFDNIIAQYYDGLDINDERTTKVLDYLSTINDTDRKIFLLFAEFGSYRKVAVQTNRSHAYIGTLVKNIRKDIIKIMLT